MSHLGRLDRGQYSCFSNNILPNSQIASHLYTTSPTTMFYLSWFQTIYDFKIGVIYSVLSVVLKTSPGLLFHSVFCYILLYLSVHAHFCSTSTYAVLIPESRNVLLWHKDHNVCETILSQMGKFEIQQCEIVLQ